MNTVRDVGADGNKRPQAASAAKIAAHADRVRDYLQGRRVDPVTLELDLTSRCNRDCPDCPSTRAASHWNLDEPFVEKLFGRLEGRTRGLLLTGGEPTLSPIFPGTLALARQKGFLDIAVVTNGSRLHEEPVRRALLNHASTIRLSLYDWEMRDGPGPAPVLEQVGRLRQEIERRGSSLQIGVSALTSTLRLDRLEPLVKDVIAAGAHWVYFHPHCRNWKSGRPRPEAQDGVAVEIARLTGIFRDRIDIQYSAQRYERVALRFSGYHAAHFLLVVGADKKNYLGAEVKYHPGYAVADFAHNGRADFLADPRRLASIAAHTSKTYGAASSRHRGVLYNDFIERLKGGNPSARAVLDDPPPFRFPHVL